MNFLAYATGGVGGEGDGFGAFIPLLILLLTGYLVYRRFKNKAAKHKIPTDTRVTTKVIGTSLIIGGIIALLCSLSMDTSVSSSLGGRIHNIGLMNQKQNYVMVSALILLIGIIITVFRQRGVDSNTSTATIVPETKQCPYCAEEIKPEALICRYCGREQPQKEAKDKYTEKDNRILCPDQRCVGIIDPDGRCSECGKIFTQTESMEKD